MPVAPKANSIFESGGSVTPVLGADGVAQTATIQAPPSVEAPANPVAPSGGVLPQAPQETEPEFDLESYFQDEMLNDILAVRGRGGAGEFIPEDARERSAFEAGSAGSVFRQGFNQGFLGAAFNADLMTPEKQAQIEGEVLNYSGRHPYWAFASGMAGRFTSDLPIEVVVSLATGGTGAAAHAIATTGRYGRSAQKVALSLAKLRKAAKTGTLAQRTTVEVGQDALEGFASGMLSEGIRVELGRGSSMEQAIQAGLNDALVSPVFGFLIRSGLKLGGRAGSAAKEKFFDRVQRDVVEDLRDDMSPEDLKSVELAVDDLRQKVLNSREDIAQGKRLSVNKNFRGRLKDVDATLKKQSEPELRGVLRSIRSSVKRAGGNEAAKLFDNIEVSVTGLPDGIAGRYVYAPDSKSFGRIEISPTARDPAKTFVHEATHAVTAQRLSELPVDSVERQAILRLMDDARAALPDFNGQAFDSEFEFIAEAFSNPEFQMQLKNIRASSPFAGDPKSSLWTLFIKAVKRLIGAEGVKDSVLESVIRAADSLIGAQAKQLDRTAVKNISPAKRFAGQAQLYTAPVEKPVPTPDMAAAQQRLDDIAADVKSDDLSVNIQGGDMYPKSDLGKWWASLKNSSPLLSWSNSTLNMILPQLGGVGKRIAAMGYEAANVTGKLAVKMDRAFRDGIKGIDQSDFVRLKEKKKYTLKTHRLENDNTLSFHTVDLELSGLERLWLTLMSRDGLKSLNDIGSDVPRSQHSGGDSLIFPGRFDINEFGERVKTEAAGFRMGEKNIVLTRKQRDDIARGALIQSEAEGKMLDAINASYRSIVDDVNSISQQLTGRDVLDPNNAYYSPKFTMSGIMDFDEAGRRFDMAFDPRQKGAIMERTGLGKLKPVNPFDQLSLYTQRTSQVVGHLEYNQSLKVMLDTAETDGILSEGIGGNLPAIMYKLLRVSQGDHSQLGRNPDSVFSKVFTFRQLGILYANVSATLKQPASVWTASATGLLNESGSSLLGRAAKYLVNPKALKERLDKIESAVPAFAQRQMRSARMFDVDDVGSGSMHLVMGRNLKTTEILKMLFKGDMKVSDAMVELLEKGLFSIRRFDEATMAALYDASVDTVRSRPSGRSADDLFTQLMMDTQPTRTPTTASFNQQRGDVFVRAVTQFTTPTRKVAELADARVTKYFNLPEAERDGTARTELMSTLLPLVMQSAYAAGAGYVATEATNVAAQTVESRNQRRIRRRRERMDRRQRDVVKAILGKILRTNISQVPIAGSALDSIVAAMFDQHSFAMTTPILGEIAEAAKGYKDEDFIRMYKNLSRLAGAPGIANKFIESSLR